MTFHSLIVTISYEYKFKYNFRTRYNRGGYRTAAGLIRPSSVYKVKRNPAREHVNLSKPKFVTYHRYSGLKMKTKKRKILLTTENLKITLDIVKKGHIVFCRNELSNFYHFTFNVWFNHIGILSKSIRIQNPPDFFSHFLYLLKLSK